jgi:hypothetical protein
MLDLHPAGMLVVGNLPLNRERQGAGAEVERAPLEHAAVGAFARTVVDLAPLPTLVVQKLLEPFEVVGANRPGDERAAGCDRLLHAPPEVAARDLAFINDGNQLQVGGT